MSQYIRRFAPSIVLSLALVSAGCQADSADDTLAQDTSALNRDLNMANRDSLAQPQLTDIPAATPTTTAPATSRPTTTAPRTTTPPRRTTPPRSTTPAPRTTASGNTVSTGTSTGAGSGAVGTIAAGTVINLSSNQRVCTNTNKVGDTFTATVAESVTGSNGAVIPAGATATVRVTALKRSENVNDKATVGLSVTSITYGGRTYAVDTDINSAQTENVRNQSKGKDAQKVLTGAAIGAVLGQVIGKDTKGTVIGAAAGAAAGTGAAVATANYEACIPNSGRIQIKLNTDEQVRI